MSAPEAGRRGDATAAGNDLVPLALGLMRLLDRVAAAAAATAAAAPVSEPSSARNEQVLAALLGVLSVRRTVRRWLDAAALEPERSEHGAPAPRPARGSWLR
jgi:hypothetical protein